MPAPPARTPRQRTRPSGIAHLVGIAALAGTLLIALVGCGASDAGPSSGTSTATVARERFLVADRPPGDLTALAIDGTAWRSPTRLEVGTECADDLQIFIDVDHGGSDLTEITIWGRPKVGRCRPTATVRLRPSTTKIVDGTTSQVVTLPAR